MWKHGSEEPWQRCRKQRTHEVNGIFRAPTKCQICKPLARRPVAKQSEFIPLSSQTRGSQSRFCVEGPKEVAATVKHWSFLCVLRRAILGTRHSDVFHWGIVVSGSCPNLLKKTNKKHRAFQNRSLCQVKIRDHHVQHLSPTAGLLSKVLIARPVGESRQMNISEMARVASQWSYVLEADKGSHILPFEGKNAG